MTDRPPSDRPEAEVEAGAAPRPARWLRALLSLSLALNLLVAGLALGAWLSHRAEDRDRGRTVSLARDLGLGPYLWALAPQDRQALGAAAAERRDMLREGRREARETFARALETLRAEPFDAAGFAGLLETQSAAAARARDLGQELLVARVAGMTPGERAALADRLEQALRRHGRGHPGERR